MKSRRAFLKDSTLLSLGLLAFPKGKVIESFAKPKVGIQLYSVRKEMMMDAKGTLEILAKQGYKEIESARSDKGNYYGLSPKEILQITRDLNLKLISGHVQIDDDFQKSIDQAAEARQTYLICSSFSKEDLSIDNYKAQADRLNHAGEACKKSGLIFGYHNHESEFTVVDGKILYDVLLENTDPIKVKMEMDLGWVLVSGNNPITYFKRYPGRFPLWHLKDMDVPNKHSTEFGKGSLPIVELYEQRNLSGMKHFFVEQEEYSYTALESSKYDIEYFNHLDLK